jgi:thiamine transport system substrate-binding protein
MKRLLILASFLAAGCGSTNGNVTLTVLAHESFTPSEGIFEEFTADTGIQVEVIATGDAGAMVTKATLTSGNPEGDVMWGVDNTLLSRALEADVFAPYASPLLDSIDPTLLDGVPGNEVTPVDTGDVCINYDIEWFASRGIDPPSTFRDLIDPRLRGLLVVQSPLKSSPGFAFLLATIDEFGENGWQVYWESLRDNDVLVTSGWTEAYYTEFSGSSGNGSRPIVVSYGSSPPAEVVFADPPTSVAPTAVAVDTCFRQVEYAGVLRGTKHQREAEQLIDYLLGETFQSDLPLTQFVYPVNPKVTLPEVFVTHAKRPTNPRSMPPATITENRMTWLDEWNSVFR